MFARQVLGRIFPLLSRHLALVQRQSRHHIRRFRSWAPGHLAITGGALVGSIAIFGSNSRKDDSSVNPVHHYGWTRLHEMVMNGSREDVRRLLEQGADPNVRDEFTARTEGTLDEVFDRIREREKHFPRLAQQQSQGATPLHYAMLRGDVELVSMLFEAGADPTIVDKAGRTPRDYASNASVLRTFNEKSDGYEERKQQLEREYRRQFPLEQRLREVIVGQDDAIDTMASALRRRENGWQDEEKPLVCLFLGSSGIGKTELAKQIAKYLYRDVSQGFIRVDMSEYQTKHEVSKFIGAPPGYIGYDEGGQLTEKLRSREKEGVVVLLDEVEKAHPDLLTVMLQVFDEGRLTDGKGETVDCRNAIFVMTSNLAQEEIATEGVLLGSENRGVVSSERRKQFLQDTIYPILRNHFQRDEFLGRIDEILVFLPFTRNELKGIASKELERWKARAAERHHMSLSWSPEIIEALVDSYNPHYGARSLKYEVNRSIINPIAKAHEMNQIAAGAEINVCMADGKVKLDFVQREAQSGWKSIFRK